MLTIAAGGLVGALAAGAALWWFSTLGPTMPTIAPANLATTAVANDAENRRREGGSGRLITPRVPSRPRTVLPVLTSTYEWPREPETPVGVDDARFAEALVLLCGPHADREVRTWYAPWILRASRELGADPFLLGAVVFRESRCEKKARGDRIGLAGLDPGLLERDLRGGVLHYRAFSDGQWVEKTLALERFPFQGDFIASPESNLYFAAGLLHVFEEAQRGLRGAFVHRSEYRHYVSHYAWGDQVMSHREEDWILVERRRFLEYYGALKPRPPITWRGFELGCPLDGCPRVVTSTLGDSRADGKRLHAGNDFESTQGEPVRAVGDGQVVFAGVDMPGRGAASKIPIWAQRNVDPETMGVGGLYVCIDHGVSSDGEKLMSCYMHLEAATVVQGRLVKRGEQVGRVGTSGIKESRPHLHFELHAGDGVHAALEVLRGLAIGNPVLRPPNVLQGAGESPPVSGP
jgi:murein DD-endopeptidase MepM/ murein hydrolase activator NlpD